MTTDYAPEAWESPTGVAAELHPVPTPADMEWYPDFPGQRPPQLYEMRVGDRVIHDFVVFPLEPCSPYDAAFDNLTRDGWTPPPPRPEDLEVCEHGLSARLCAGPDHYPPDDY